MANITTPLLGLVDTAILGRMESVAILAGAAIASLIITQIYWICGFLKMSLTGLSAQALPQQVTESLKVLVQGFFLGLIISSIILFVQFYILDIGLALAKADVDVAFNARIYFEIRIWGAPAALCNMAIIGWLIGQQKTKLVLYLQLLINLTNIIGSLVFVYVFDWGVQGVAAATLLAEYTMLAVAVVLIVKLLNNRFQREYVEAGQSSMLPAERVSGQSKLIKQWLSFSQLKSLLTLNSHIFFRNLALQFTLAFITLTGARYGATAVAINTIILQFFALIALGLDGVANAVEALVGEAKGLKNKVLLNKQVLLGLVWSNIFALIYALMFYYLDSPIVNLLTTHADVIEAIKDYKWIIVLLPLIAHWCFLFDGVFVGLGLGKPMRDTMILSTVFGFLLPWWISKEVGLAPENMALWVAMLVFVFFRGGLLGGYYWHCYKSNANKLLN